MPRAAATRIAWLTWKPRINCISSAVARLSGTFGASLIVSLHCGSHPLDLLGCRPSLHDRPPQRLLSLDEARQLSGEHRLEDQVGLLDRCADIRGLQHFAE